MPGTDIKEKSEIKKSFAQSVVLLIESGDRWFKRHPVFSVLCIAACLELVIEVLCRRSPMEGFFFIFKHPLSYFSNMIIITMTLSPALAFKKRAFFLAFPSAVWLGLGIAECIMLGFRTTPLTAIDFSLLFSVFSIMQVYLKIWQVVMIIAAAAAVLIVLILIYMHAPCRQSFYKQAFFLFFSTFVIASITILCFMGLSNKSQSFGNLKNAYNKFGFPLCFSISVIDRGVSEPMMYSDNTVGEIVDNLEEGDTALSMTDTDSPNIIMLQLESFFDVNYLLNIECSENPVPVFEHLKKQYPSGFLSVPSVGAGTANTEFEIITGMNLEYFGVGEYPYKTTLMDTTCETVCYNLKERGYATHAIHNHTATFYDRNVVFSNMGFDTFTSVEYMQNVERNPLGWAKDKVLISEVFSALESTAGDDFIYSISVQGHGKYPTEVIDENQTIKVAGMENGTDTIRAEYYVNQLHEMDHFIGDLISALSDFREPVVLVLYGDHLPSFDISDEALGNENVFQTEYVIWSNFGLKAKDQDLEAYQLSSYVIGLLGMDNGMLTKLHQTREENPKYQENLKMLEYDMLFGDMTVYGGTNPYTPTDLQMGTREIGVTSIKQLDGALYVTGKNFTPYSKVMVDGKQKETIFINAYTLIALKTVVSPGDRVAVAQVSDDKVILSTTADFIALGEG